MKILHIDCSPRVRSHSRGLSAAIVARLLAEPPGASVIRRDLGREPIPHPQSDYANALSSAGALSAGLADGTMQLSEELILEIEAADAIVIGTPMNNFTVPSVLKAWIDHVLRIGRSFSPTPNGKKGLIADRPVFVGIASGGVFWGERANQPDFLTPYLSAALGCIGLKSIDYLPLQATAFLDEEQLSRARDDLVAEIKRRPFENTKIRRKKAVSSR